LKLQHDRMCDNSVNLRRLLQTSEPHFNIMVDIHMVTGKLKYAQL